MNKEYTIYGYLLYYVLRILSLTWRVKIIGLDKLDKNKNKYIFSFWHNRLIVPTVYMKDFGKCVALVSPSKDGELIGIPLRKFGFTLIRGSSDKKATSSVRELLRALKKGYNIGTPVDGPKGPIYEVKHGLVFIAQKTQNYVVPFGGAYSKFWTFSKTWDKFMLPKPFAKIVFVVGDPYQIPKDEDINISAQNLKDKIIEVDNIAKENLKGEING